VTGRRVSYMKYIPENEEYPRHVLSLYSESTTATNIFFIITIPFQCQFFLIG
jgi:hypothetical protein